MIQDYIPYELRSLVTQIDPYLDLYWQNNLSTIFSQIDPEQRDRIYRQILLKKISNGMLSKIALAVAPQRILKWWSKRLSIQG